MAPAPKPADPIRPTDDEARALARRLMAEARHGALGVLDPVTGAPLVSRVAVGLQDGDPLILVSSLAAHAGALRADPRCSLLLGEPGRGDPLAYPRITLVARAEGASKAALRSAWLGDRPKSALYYDFADFALLRLRVVEAHLNGGFGRAFRLTPDDLRGG
jgi:hypothetical protein